MRGERGMRGEVERGTLNAQILRMRRLLASIYILRIEKLLNIV